LDVEGQAMQILFVPCIATLAAIRSETKSWRWSIVSVVLLLVISLTVAIVIYQGGKLLHWL